MKNNTELKTVLAQKSAYTQVPAAATPSLRLTNRNTAGQDTQDGRSMCVTVSFTMPLEEVAGFLDRVRPMLPQQDRPISTAPSRSEPAALPEPTRPSAAIDRISDKQIGMIKGLVKRKGITTDEVARLMQNEFGISDPTMLSKRDASQLINRLMAG